MAALSSCNKEEPYYPPVEPEVVGPDIHTVLITVKANQWDYSKVNNNNYYFATVDMPEITQEAFKTGLIKMYRVWNWGGSDATQMEMPYSRHIEEYYEDGEENWWYYYTESIDYEYSVGKVTICYTLSDFYYEVDESYSPDQMQFRCVIVN